MFRVIETEYRIDTINEIHRIVSGWNDNGDIREVQKNRMNSGIQDYFLAMTKVPYEPILFFHMVSRYPKIKSRGWSKCLIVM